MVQFGQVIQRKDGNWVPLVTVQAATHRVPGLRLYPSKGIAGAQQTSYLSTLQKPMVPHHLQELLGILDEPYAAKCTDWLQ